MLWLLIRDCNCTPTQALFELRSNPHLNAILNAKHYGAAFEELKEWRDRNEKPKEPSGYWVERVKENEALLAAEASEARRNRLSEQERI